MYLVVMYTLTVYVFVMCDCYRCEQSLYIQILASSLSRLQLAIFSSYHRSLIKQVPFVSTMHSCRLFVFIVNQLILAVDVQKHAKN
jgi:hypothetical protein